MRGVHAVLLTAGLMALAVSPVTAQPLPAIPGFGLAGMMSAPIAAMLLRNDKVQEELKLTDDQKTAIKNASDKVRAKYQEDLDKARADRDFQKVGELQKARGEEIQKAMFAALKPEQVKRLKQIEVQAAGLDAFSKEDVETALKLTDKQKKDVKEVVQDLQKDTQDLFKDAPGDREKMTAAMKKVQTLHNAAFDKVVGGLTDEQKKTWKDLTGDKFEVAAGFGPGFGPSSFGPSARGMMQVSAAILVRNNKVQEELKLTDDQKADIKKAGDAIRAKYKDAIDKARADLDFQKAGELQRTQGDDVEKALAGVLKSEQSKRLKQIEVQAAGLAAFDQENVQAALKLTDAQKKAVEDARADVQKGIEAAFKDAADDRDKMADAFKKTQTLGADALDKVVKGLSDDQKKTWKDLTGDKFEVQFGPPGGPRPGRNP